MPSPFKSLRAALKSPTARVEHLRTVVGAIRTSTRLEGLPDTIISLLSAYDNISLDPTMRQDIHDLIAGSCEISNILLDPVTDAKDALLLISHQQELLSRMMRHLMTRPSKMGFSVLNIRTKGLMGHYATREEAQGYLDMLQGMGTNLEAVVIPVQITSQFAIRPEPAPPMPDPDTTGFDLPQVLRKGPDRTTEPQDPEELPPGAGATTNTTHVGLELKP